MPIKKMNTEITSKRPRKQLKEVPSDQMPGNLSTNKNNNSNVLKHIDYI